MTFVACYTYAPENCIVGFISNPQPLGRPASYIFITFILCFLWFCAFVSRTAEFNFPSTFQHHQGVIISKLIFLFSLRTAEPKKIYSMGNAKITQLFNSSSYGAGRLKAHSFCWSAKCISANKNAIGFCFPGFLLLFVIVFQMWQIEWLHCNPRFLWRNTCSSKCRVDLVFVCISKRFIWAGGAIEMRLGLLMPDEK